MALPCTQRQEDCPAGHSRSHLLTWQGNFPRVPSERVRVRKKLETPVKDNMSYVFRRFGRGQEMPLKSVQSSNSLLLCPTCVSLLPRISYCLVTPKNLNSLTCHAVAMRIKIEYSKNYDNRISHIFFCFCAGQREMNRSVQLRVCLSHRD